MAPPNESSNETENRIGENVETTEENTCPDGGWGWVIAVAACATRIIKQVVNISFGILFSGVLIQIGASSSAVGWIFNICLTMTDVSKFFAGPLGDVIGWRQVSIYAGLCCSLCTFALIYASSVTYMIIFFSFGLGISTGLILSTTYLATAFYFDKNRGKAFGLMFSGVNLGKFCGPILITFLLENYGYKGTVLIISAIQLNLCVIGAVLHPVKWHMKKPKNQVRKKKSRTNFIEENLQDSTYPYSYIVEVWHKFINLLNTILKALQSNITALRSYRALFLSIAHALYLVGHINFQMIIPFQMQSKGYTLKDAAICISANAIICTISQPFFAILADWQKFNNKLGLSVGLVGLCIALFGFTFAPSRLWVIVLASFAGLFNGWFVSLMSIVMVDSLGIELFKASYGISGIFVAASSLAIGPLLGLIRDMSGSYDLSMRLSAGLVLLSLALIILLPIAVKLDKEKTELQTADVSNINAL